MVSEDQVHRIADLLQQADSAHHTYEKKVLKGGRDVSWPEWYAEYLIGHGLDLLMDERLATELLVSFLQRSREEHYASAPGISWEEFTARMIVEKLV